ncbi:MAG: hypothetical protein LBU07_04610 [Coriobacteriales bacterium]|nr:hypothetical protein [Coriobacteriales bacterium]
MANLLFFFVGTITVSSLTIATPLASYADEKNTLLERGQYFDRSSKKVATYHFAILYKTVEENGEIVGPAR